MDFYSLTIQRDKFDYYFSDYKNFYDYLNNNYDRNILTRYGSPIDSYVKMQTTCGSKNIKYQDFLLDLYNKGYQIIIDEITYTFFGCDLVLHFIDQINLNNPCYVTTITMNQINLFDPSISKHILNYLLLK